MSAFKMKPAFMIVELICISIKLNQYDASYWKGVIERWEYDG
jgi:hypothetical protein